MINMDFNLSRTFVEVRSVEVVCLTLHAEVVEVAHVRVPSRPEGWLEPVRHAEFVARSPDYVANGRIVVLRNSRKQMMLNLIVECLYERRVCVWKGGY